MREAEIRYLDRIAADCHDVLGPGVELLALEVEKQEAQTRLIARYRLGHQTGESYGEGADLLTAHITLRSRLAQDRVRLGFVALVTPRH